IAWLYDATVHVDEVDADFLACLDDVRAAYAAMSPKLSFAGELVARPVSNSLWHPTRPPLLLFSGGVDSVYSMLGNLALKPTLLSVWGADTFFRDDAPWNKVYQANREMADRFGLGYETIKTSFRLFINTDVLDERFAKSHGSWGNWWHGFQCGIGLLGLAAPLAWQRKTRSIIISSTYSSKDSRFIPCASDPTIDMALRFAGCQCQHYDYTVSRQEKVAYIREQAEVLRKAIPLRACWVAQGHNCGLCDKCLRTLFALHAEGADPAQFGFPVDEALQAKIVERIRDGKILKTPFWDEPVRKLRSSPQTERHVVEMLRYFEQDFRSEGTARSSF
ncbi:MAG TPA: hypothetical protein VEC60_04505, partial [Reyranella sp.]|nr:hypothetical protein [Reyranella sp.]